MIISVSMIRSYAALFRDYIYYIFVHDMYNVIIGVLLLGFSMSLVEIITSKIVGTK